MARKPIFHSKTTKMYRISTNPDEWTPEQRKKIYERIMQVHQRESAHPLQYGQLSQFPARSQGPLEKKAKIQDWITRMRQIEKEMVDELNTGQAESQYHPSPRTLSEALFRLAAYVGKIEDRQEKENRKNL